VADQALEWAFDQVLPASPPFRGAVERDVGQGPSRMYARRSGGWRLPILDGASARAGKGDETGEENSSAHWQMLRICNIDTRRT